MIEANWEHRKRLVQILLIANLALMVVMGYKVAEPYITGLRYTPPAETKIELPKYDLSVWESWPVLEEGRVKPLQTVAIEAVRNITGRATFEGQGAMPVFLSWLFYDAKNPAGNKVDWDRYPFILCEDHELRAAIYKLDKDDPNVADLVHAKRISPMDLYNSVPFQRLVVEVNRKEQLDQERYEQTLESLERKANTVYKRLRLYERLTGLLDARNKPGIRENRMLLFDPVHFVALDRVPNSSWFSMGELRYLTSMIIAPMMSPEENANMAWINLMQERVALQPRLYLDESARKSLTDFQAALKQGRGEAVLAELEKLVNDRTQQELEKTRADALKQVEKMTDAEFRQFAATMSMPNMSRDEMKRRILENPPPDSTNSTANSKKALNNLRKSIASIRMPFVAEDERYNQLYMAFLETRHPDLYLAAVKSQRFPDAQARSVLASYDAVAAAYRSGDPSQFNNASTAFFKNVTEVSKQFTSDAYPGETTVALEMQLNKVEPFKWAWISMLFSVIIFALSLKLDSRELYIAGFVPMLVSLGFQIYAYYGRVAISGRPPVSNMFETVVFVASMGAVFALVLEYFYRNKIIILSGAIIGTLGMILADQLPYSRGFDAKIDPLQPVLRSNYWLIIHVMTIVASYAAGALAWAIGNISLILYWFNSDRKDLLKTLSNLCYSAIKVAVLLLGVGTLLGGIWAAESWGRFWGWDPKETWALIALVTYLLPLHARYIGWVKDFGMAITSVVCFAAIVMSWYGVNFILGAGLHSYGMGDGGPWTIFFLGSVNLLWVLLVCYRRASSEVAAVA